MLYSKAMSRFGYVLSQLNMIPFNNNEETLRYRFNNRFKIFSQVYFIKKLDYKEYIKYMKEFLAGNDMVL